MYCFGVADPSGELDKLNAHLYTEGQGGKGGNNVASLIMKTLRVQGLLRDGDPGHELSIIMDNCGGQNKNRMVLWLALYLVELGYFNAVNICFLIRGHTKNLCDRLFNLLKKHYRPQNIYTMEMLKNTLASEQVEVHTVQPGDFGNYDQLLDEFYLRFPTGTVQTNHIFRVEKKEPTTIHVSAADEEKLSCIDMKLEKEGESAGDRKLRLKATACTPLDFPGIKRIKQIELARKWHWYVPLEYRDFICPEVSKEMLEKEKVARKHRREEQMLLVMKL